MSTTTRMTTTISGHFVGEKFHFEISHGAPEHEGDSILFRIEGNGRSGPRTAPNPATRDELNDWIDRLEAAGYSVIRHH